MNPPPDTSPAGHAPHGARPDANAPALVIVDGLRTPFCRFNTDLATLSAVDLARVCATALLLRHGVEPASIDEVVFGCVSQPVDSANPARVAALRSGLPASVPAATVQRNCASGLEALFTAHQRLAAGHGEVFLIGGMESMSQVPLYVSALGRVRFEALAAARTPWAKLAALASFRPRHLAPVIGLKLGLTDPFSGLNMGETAELLAREFSITRADQDGFALQSHRRADRHRETHAGEIAAVFPVNGSAPGDPVTADNGIRPDTNLDSLARLKPAFDRRGGGTVTPGNSSQITDGAAALLVAGEHAARRHGWPVLARVIDYAVTGCDPERMGLGPVRAIAEACRRTGLGLDDADVIEINEAFAAQVLAVCKAMSDPAAARMAGLDEPLGQLDPARLNRRGGAIAFGHPVGATGARLIISAARQLRATGGRHALVSVCVGGGQGVALWLENPAAGTPHPDEPIHSPKPKS